MPYAGDYGYSIAGQLPATEAAIIANKRLTNFRNCFEAAMDVDTAMECCGFTDSEMVQRAARQMWNMWEAKFENGL